VVSNAAGAAPTNSTVTVTDTLPAGLTLVSMTGAGWSCGGNSCKRSDALAGGASYPPVAVTVNVAANAGPSLVNTAAVSGGGSVNATATDPTTVGVSSPILSISKSHTGSFTQGQAGALYTVIVSNAATAGPTSGTVTMTETVPAGLTLVSMSGTGWTCAAVTCTRADALAAGARYPPISVSVNVAATAASPQVNAVTVSGGGSAAASASDSTAIVSGAALLSISKSHAGNFAPGQTGVTYALLVANAAGAAPTAGTVTVTEAPPAGLTLVSMSGTGWTCSANTCARVDVLGAGGTYPAITVTANVAPAAVSPLVNVASVSGGGSAPASAADSAIVAALSPALSITKSHVGNFTQGQANATYTVTVANGPGAGPTNGTVTVAESVPAGLALISMQGTGWTCAGVSCTRADSLAGGGSYPPITVTVNVATTAVSPVVNVVTVSGGNSASASASDPAVILAKAPILSIVSSHTGNFVLGQVGATYSLVVSNAALAPPTNSTVSVSDSIPAGMTFVSMSGTGWTCGGNSCKRADALAAGASYPPITVTVNVAVNAGSPLVNNVTVSGGGSNSASASDSTIITP
jgi:uncharacterized repeat protein (TIGR01451 family)